MNTGPAHPSLSHTPQFEAAMRHHQAGQLQQAESLYRQILQATPNDAEALHGLGLIAYQVGQFQAAVDLMGRAIAARPGVARFHNHLAGALQGLGRLDEARAQFERALALNPQSATVLNNFGNLLRRVGRIEQAIDYFGRAIEASPAMVEARVNLAAALVDAGRADEAVVVAREAVSLHPALAEAHNNLANALKAAGHLEAAAEEACTSLRLKPNYRDANLTLGHIRSAQARHAEAADVYQTAIASGGGDAPTLNMLAVALLHVHRIEEARAAIEQAIQLQPDFAAARLTLGRIQLAEDRVGEAAVSLNLSVALAPTSADAWWSLSTALARLGRLGEAVSACERGLALNPESAGARNDLGILLLRQGRVEEAITQFTRALELDPQSIDADINLLHAAHYLGRQDNAAAFNAHVAWATKHTAKLATGSQIYPNNRSPNRRLKIGYVSGDFRAHPVGRFVLPLLQSHDSEQVETHCYDCFPARADDSVAHALRGACQQWHTLLGVDDERAAELIQSHEIDILVDLSGHTSFNRLLVFAREPAPIRITYLGYPDTTGMASMDYRVTDAVADPPGEADRLHFEKLLRLPGGFLCYQPSAAGASPLPALKNGYVTFGSFNKLAKITPAALEVWANILRQVPDSRLIIKTPSLRDPPTQSLARETFLHHGIAEDRLELLGQQDTHAAHLAVYERVEIALDTFPYNGTTTTCDALAMGVPVVTVAGDRHVSRVSASILSHAGLEHLIARDLDEYARIACALASDVQTLAANRSELREKVRASSVCDPKRLAREMEQAYRQVWRDWCAVTPQA